MRSDNGFQPWELGEYIESTVLQHKYEKVPITQLGIDDLVHFLNYHSTDTILMYLKDEY